MNRRRMIAALWAFALAACTSLGLFLFAQVQEPDCDAALLIAASNEAKVVAGSSGPAADLAACKSTEGMLVVLQRVALGLGAAALLALAAALFFRLQSRSDPWPQRVRQRSM